MNENLQVIRTEDEARAKGRNGGKASGEARRRKKALRELVKSFGFLPVSNKDSAIMSAMGIPEGDHTRFMQSVVSLFNKAAKGDVSAFNAIRDIIGEKPREELAVDIPNTLRVEIVGGDTYIPSSEDEVEE